MKNLNQLQQALNAINLYQFRQESSYADYDAEKNLAGRTHYADKQTLKYFKSKILRAIHSTNGLFYIIQESLPHPDFDMKRVRRNVVFDVFGNVVFDSRSKLFTSSKKADDNFRELLDLCNTSYGIEFTLETLKQYIARQDTNLFIAKQYLE